MVLARTNLTPAFKRLIQTKIVTDPFHYDLKYSKMSTLTYTAAGERKKDSRQTMHFHSLDGIVRSSIIPVLLRKVSEDSFNPPRQSIPLLSAPPWHNKSLRTSRPTDCSRSEDRYRTTSGCIIQDSTGLLRPCFFS